MHTVSTGSGSKGRLWRSRWAAIGAAVAVTLGAGGLVAVNAAPSAPSSVVTIDPVRILDTRTDVGLPGPFVSAVSQKLQVTGTVPTASGTQAPVPTGATGVLLNVTVVSPTADGFVSVRPGDATGKPTTSSLNFKKDEIVPNSVQVGLPTSGTNAGKIDITYDAFGTSGPRTELLVDVVGYMAASGAAADGVQLQPFEVRMGFGSTQTIATNGDLELILRCRSDDNTPDSPAFPATNRQNMQLRAFSTGRYMTSLTAGNDIYSNTGVTVHRALGSSTPGTKVQTTFKERDGQDGVAVTATDGRQISVAGSTIQVMFNVTDPVVGSTVDCYARGVVMLVPART